MASSLICRLKQSRCILCKGFRFTKDIHIILSGFLRMINKLYETEIPVLLSFAKVF